MNRVYFDNKVIIFTKLKDIQLSSTDTLDVTKLLQKVENSKCDEHEFYVDESLLSQFADFFQLRKAAGGVVRDSQGRVLMIFRNGRWDLPKGHLESGETLQQCAAREVCEECGLDRVEVRDQICETEHIYRWEDYWVLKHTYWYAMRTDSGCALTPQTVEGIECADWRDAEQVRQSLANSYRTICEVFEKEKHLTI